MFTKDDRAIEVHQLDWSDPVQAGRLVALLNDYAHHPFGSGKSLPDDVLQRLPEIFPQSRGGFSLVAVDTHAPEDEPDRRDIGLANCLYSFSSFRAAPLINVHDLFVRETARGRGVGRLLLQSVCDRATELGASHVSLEVLTENMPARRLYHRMGFVGTDPDIDLPKGLMLFGKRECVSK